MTRLQAKVAVACMFFGLFDYKYIDDGTMASDGKRRRPSRVNVQDEGDYPIPSLIHIFTSRRLFPLQCLLGYFAPRANQDHDQEVVIFRRIAAAPSYDWASSPNIIPPIHVGDCAITETPAKLQLAFCHEIIGKKAFAGITNQEEITLLTYPECIAAMLFCANLEHDSLVVIGARMAVSCSFSSSGASYQDVRKIDDCPARDSRLGQTLQRVIVFVDAAQPTAGRAQFIDNFDRDLAKLHTGLSTFAGSRKAISGGNWTYGGCSGHNMQVKFLQQLMASAATDMTLIYHPWGAFEQDYGFFLEWINDRNITVAALYQAYRTVINGCGRGARFNELELLDCIIDELEN